MSFPKLSELALNKVLESLGGDKLHPSLRPLPAEISNKIFKMAGNISSVPSQLLLNQLSHYFSVTEIDLTGTIMTIPIVPMLNSQNLKSLSTGYFWKVQGYRGDSEDREDYDKYAPQNSYGARAVSDHTKKIRHIIDIEEFLEDALNEKSRRELIHLDLSPEPQGNGSHGFDEHFVDGWAEEVGKMLPSLTSLALRQRILPDFEFSNICTYFPNLLKLDLTNTCLESLYGISALKNLQTLWIGCLKIKEAKGIRQLFDLKELRHLSFETTWISCWCCNSGNAHEWYLKTNRRLRNLETVDFSMTRIKDATVRRFVKIHRNLKAVSICRSLAREITYPRIEVYHSNNVQGCVKSLQYYTEMKNIVMVDAVMDSLCDQLRKESAGNATDEDFQQALKVVNAAIELYSCSERIVRHGFYIYGDLLKQRDVSTFAVEDRKKMIELLLISSIHETNFLKQFPASIRDVMTPWDILNNRDLLFRTPLLDLTRIASLALKILEITEKGYSCPHLIVLDILKDVLNIDAEALKVINFKKVQDHLKTLKDDDGPYNSHVTPIAKRLFEFVEIYFSDRLVD